MNEYVFSADLLNKFSQLTPWVQALIGSGFCTVIIAMAYFFKESIAVAIKPFLQDKGKE